ncbi:MAG: hypothetical protein KDI00_02440 [Pseudomonadales bacterium]|nr:hypothetical protein [Pseudomonadales bacterium]
MLANKLEIRRLLEEDWKYDPTALATCLAIFDYLSTNDISQVRHISFVSLKTITNANDLPTLIKAINYLSGARLPLLDTNFEFIDEITDVSYPLSRDDYQEIVKENEFCHPETGLPVSEYKKHIFIYFTPSDLAKNIVGAT